MNILDDYRVIINNSSWFLRTYLRNWLLIFFALINLKIWYFGREVILCDVFIPGDASIYVGTLRYKVMWFYGF